MKRRVVLIAVLLWTAAANADKARVAVAPLSSLTEATGNLAPVEKLLETAVAAMPDRDVVPAQAVRRELRKARRRELESCEADPGCLAELGRVAGAAVVVAGEASALGDDLVVYLKAIDVARAVEIGATTWVAPLRAAAQVDALPAARAAAYRLLAPKDYAGLLVLRIDVPGATVFVDGQRVGTAPVAPMNVGVGTHAVRVTHPTYRDFVRFVEVGFGERTEVGVDLSAYPVVSDAMRPDLVPRDPGRPWYKSPWALVGAGAVLATAAVVTVILFFPPSPSRDLDVTLGPR